MFLSNLKSKLIIAVIVIFGITALMSCETDSIDSDYNNGLQEKESNIETLAFEKKEFNLDYLNSIGKIPVLIPKPIGNKISKTNNAESIDTDLFIELLQKDVLTSEENYNLILILHALGFQSLEDFQYYSNQINKFVEKIVAETNFLDLDEDIKYNVLFDYFNQNDIWSNGTNKSGNSCISGYNACNNAVTTQYNTNVALCTAGAVAMIETGPVALGFDIVCLGAAYANAIAGYQYCDASYEDCLGGN